MMLLNRRAGRGNPDLQPLIAFTQYLESISLTHRASTLKLKRYAVLPFLRNAVRMANITPQSIEDWKTSMTKEYRMDTVSLRLRELRAFINWCTKRGDFPESPFKLQIPPSSFVGRRLTQEELMAIGKACYNEFRPFFILACETGARKGEILGMLWEEIDMVKGAWHIPAHRCKTKYSRTIPLSDAAQWALQSVLGPNNTKPALGPVFPNWTPFKVKYHWSRVLKLAGIQGRARIHDLRHTFASDFKGRWPSLKAICGWRTDAMASHYTHTTFEELKEDMLKNSSASEKTPPALPQ